MRTLAIDTRQALRGAAIGVAVLWIVQLANATSGYELNRFGIWPRHLGGLPGVVLAPLLHGGFMHLVANTPRAETSPGGVDRSTVSSTS